MINISRKLYISYYLIRDVIAMLCILSESMFKPSKVAQLARLLASMWEMTG
jgi:hypothetical protein